MKPLLQYAKLARSLLRVPTYLLLLMYLWTGVFTGVVVTGVKPYGSHAAALILKAIVCTLIIALWYINGTALNDYADYEIDMINLKGDKDRPLVVGTATRPELLKAAWLCGGIALALALILDWRFGVLVGALLLLNTTYSLEPLQISRRGGLAPLMLPIGYIVLPVLLGYGLSTHHWYRLATIVLASLYLQFMGRIILKDYRDVKGDKKHGKMTFLLRHGNQMVCTVSAISISASSLLLVMLASQYMQTFRYAIGCLLAFSVMMLYQLAQTNQWRQQKPLIAAFGRAMTGVTAAVITGLITTIWPLKASTMALMALILVVVYIWSAQQAFQYNVLLQASKTKA